MTLTELTEIIRNYERNIAPGSEPALWGDYCERMRVVTGALPYSDHDIEPEVPDAEAEWWLAAYRGLALRSRIEAVYMAVTMEDDPRGALSWFARRARVTPRTVQRWVSGERPIAGSALSVLELLER